MNIGVLCPSDIAARRFLPALLKVPAFHLTAIGFATRQERTEGPGAIPSSEADCRTKRQCERATQLAAIYNCQTVEGFKSLISSNAIEALYIPLPPALHYRWAKAALNYGKHILVEKPFTTNLKETEELLALAEQQGLAVHENYMFAFHSQIEAIKQTLAMGDIGEVRSIRVDFGFPFRGENDFRYSRELGGGALLDAGGYTLKLAALLLGSNSHVTAASLSPYRKCNVDLFGSATLQNDAGLCAQVSFGMDNDYRCSVDIWGSKATLSSNRVLTAPPDYQPTLIIRRNGAEEIRALPADDTFKKSIEWFLECIKEPKKRKASYANIREQAKLVESVIHYASA